MIPKTWTPIAENEYGIWTELPDAPIGIDVANRMVADGVLLMAQRRVERNQFGNPSRPMQLLVKMK